MKWLVFLLVPTLCFAQPKSADVQTEFIKIVNQYRVSRGLIRVTFSEDARAASQIQSDYLASTLTVNGSQANCTVGHTHPVYPMIMDRINKVNPSLPIAYYAEICAGNWYHSQTAVEVATQLFNQWKESPDHNRIMVGPSFTKVGFHVSYKTATIKNSVIKLDPKSNTFYLTTEDSQVTSISGVAIFY